MLDIFLKVLFVLAALTMIVMILMQQGTGAQAGSGFGAGASSTVFGSKGSSNFLSKSTRNLAIVFFALSLFMSWKISHENKVPTTGAGVISAEQAAQKAPVSEVPQAPSLSPANAKPAAVLPSSTVPVAPAAVQPAAPEAAPENNKDSAKPVEQGSKAA
ncbi:MAG TPA: preprotein translocase subunit SecG [Arenimonas sp.]|jgi:preprotein translocase subunit SecG|nr:preprotein translocase subunit SecG [Arenimonas sp.]